MTKAEEDWFLRGGKRPEQQEPDTVTVEVTVCRNCGEYNLPGDTECTSCGLPLTGEPSTEECRGAEDGEAPKKFFVTVLRTKTIGQKAVVCIVADDEDSACAKANDLIEGGDPDVDDWPWEDRPDTEAYEDVWADWAEPAE